MRPLLACTVMLILLGTGTAMAGPPFQTDDADIADPGNWEFFLASQWRAARDGTTASLPHLEVNYGIIPDALVHVLLPMLYQNPSGDSAHYGYSDTEFGLKIRFVHETERVPMVSIFPQVVFPTGNHEEALGTGKIQVFLPIWFQKTFGSWITYGGGGYWIYSGEGNKNWWSWGWAVQKELSKVFSVGAELLYRTAPVDDGENSFGFNAGVLVHFNDRHHLLFSTGSDISGPARLTSYIGYLFTFGPSETERPPEK